MSGDVEKIAAGLSEAQRRAVLRFYPSAGPTAIHPGDPSIATLNCLGRLGLVEGATYARNRQWAPLGLAVKAHLEGRK